PQLGRDALRTLLTPDQLERPRLRRVAAQQPGPLEVREVGVHGGGRGETHRLADLPHRRRIAVPVDVLDEEAPDLALPAGQLGCRLHLTLRGSGKVANTCSAGGYGFLRTASNRPKEKGRPGAAYECAGEDLNLHGLLRPLGPQPSASTNS